MINLFVSYFQSENYDRSLEIERCLFKNISLNLIDKIFLFSEQKDNLHDFINRSKINYIKLQSRPKYSDFFKYIKENNLEFSINIISNADIYFNDTLDLTKYLKYDQCYALSRWENEMFHPASHSSQDAWILKNVRNNLLLNSDIEMGQPGCDNRIAHVFKECGYDICNPSHSLVINHEHGSNIRTYNNDNIIKGEYLDVFACSINDVK